MLNNQRVAHFWKPPRAIPSEQRIHRRPWSIQTTEGCSEKPCRCPIHSASGRVEARKQDAKGRLKLDVKGDV